MTHRKTAVFATLLIKSKLAKSFTQKFTLDFFLFVLAWIWKIFNDFENRNLMGDPFKAEKV